MAKNFIMVCGVSRSGKDTFATLFKSSKLLQNYKIEQYALATLLKSDCEQFLKEKCNLNVWSEDTEEKSKFRDLLLWMGNVKRILTEGQYWTSQLTPKLLASDADIAIVTDVRYTTYPKDELYWAKVQMGGILIHLDRRNGEKFILPANKHEELNDPILSNAADYHLSWDTIKNGDIGVLQPLIDDLINKMKKDGYLTKES